MDTQITVYSNPLFVRYSNSNKWDLFQETQHNHHRLHMLLLFIGSNKNEYTFIDFPHAKGGTLTATLTRVNHGFYEMTINSIVTEYMYETPEKVAHINRVMDM
jgi:hypothetical protein